MGVVSGDGKVPGQLALEVVSGGDVAQVDDDLRDGPTGAAPRVDESVGLFRVATPL